MTRFPFMAVICVSAVGLASVTQAADRDRPSFGMLDRDGSGEITQSELAAIGQSRFEAADANADGVLDRSELTAAAEKRNEARVDRMLSRLDKDGDGAISAAEMAERRDTGRMFARLDTDGSGGVSKAEFAQAQSKMRQRRGARQDAD